MSCLQKAYISQVEKDKPEQSSNHWSRLCQQLGINRPFNIDSYGGVFAESLIEAQISLFVKWNNWTCLNCCLTMVFEFLMPLNENQGVCIGSDATFQEEIQQSIFEVEEIPV